MIKRIILFLSMLVFTVSVDATTIREYFSGMPDSIMPLLSKSDRLDCMDYLDSGMKAVVNNRLGGHSEMTVLTADVISLKLTNVSSFDMKLFYRKDSTAVICVVKTYCSALCDSQISFYDTDWTSIAVNTLIDEPVFEDYLVRRYVRGDSVQSLKQMSTLRMQRIMFLNDGLSYSYSSAAYLGSESEEYLHFFSTQPIRYVWNGKKFRKISL